MTSARQFCRGGCAPRAGAHNGYAHHSLASGWPIGRVPRGDADRGLTRSGSHYVITVANVSSIAHDGHLVRRRLNERNEKQSNADHASSWLSWKRPASPAPEEQPPSKLLAKRTAHRANCAKR